MGYDGDGDGEGGGDAKDLIVGDIKVQG